MNCPFPIPILKANKWSAYTIELLKAESVTLDRFINGPFYGIIKDCIESDEFIAAKTFREQVGILTRVLRSEKEDPVPYHIIGDIFTKSRSPAAISLQEDKYNEGVKANGRPPLLTEEEKRMVKQSIENHIQEEGFPTYEDISDMIIELFDKYIALPSIRAIIRKMPEYTSVKAKPLETNRYECEYQVILEFYELLAEVLEGVPIGWLFNLDETGQQDFVDSRELCVVVPSNSESAEHAVYKVDRNGKRCTALHCISSDGKFLKPLFILPRKTIDAEVFDEISPDDVMFAETKTGFINTEAFCRWFDEVFINHIIEKRNQTGYSGKAVLIMDGFIAHHKCVEDPERAQILQNLNVEVLFIPPHSSDQVQPLDLLIFNLQKLWKSRITLEKSYSYQTKQIIEAYNSLYMASAPHYVKSSFERAGIIRSRLDWTPENGPKPQFHIVNIKCNNAIHPHIRPSQEGFDKKKFLENCWNGMRKTIPIDKF